MFHFPLCIRQGIKVPFKNKAIGPCLKKLGHPVFFFFLLFFSLTCFFRLIPWSIEAPCVHLSAQVSKTWTGRRSASSLPWETGKAPVASVNRANFLSRSFIGFLCKPRNISLCLSSIFLSTIFFPYLSLNQSPTPFFLQVPLDPAGAEPRQPLSLLGVCVASITAQLAAKQMLNVGFAFWLYFFVKMKVLFGFL